VYPKDRPRKEIDVTRLSRWLLRVSRGWIALTALAVFVLFIALVLPAQAGRARESAGGAGSPDTSLFYSVDELYGMAEAYGPAGRQAYVEARTTFDIAWPLVYTFFLTTALSWLTWRAFAPGSIWQRANLIPLLAMLFDLLENLAASIVMLRYPQASPAAAGLAPGFTALKWAFVVASFVLLALAAAALVWRRLSGKPVR
jgi:hypothetical protein